MKIPDWKWYIWLLIGVFVAILLYEFVFKKPATSVTVNAAPVIGVTGATGATQ